MDESMRYIFSVLNLLLFLNSIYASTFISAVSDLVVDAVNDSAVSIQWNYYTMDGVRPGSFHIEYAVGLYSDDFQYIDSISVESRQSSDTNVLSLSYTTTQLSPSSAYRFRVIPVSLEGYRHASNPVGIQTLPFATLNWEPILASRLRIANMGSGFSNPVLGRPHLDEGPEVFTSKDSNDSLRFSDPPTSETPAIPSGRRGHSLTAIQGYVFMFGGRTNGYSCASVYKDNFNYGNTESGRYIYPCTSKQAEVNELWSFDLHTYTWRFLNTSIWNSAPPPAREQHSAVAIDDNLYIFGGKSRTFQLSTDGQIQMQNYSVAVHGDVWKLSIERERVYSLSSSKSTVIQQNESLIQTLDGSLDPTISATSDGVTPRKGLCIKNLVVKVVVDHPCLNQLRLSLRGPGPSTGSPNFFASGYSNEVLLLDQLTANGTGCVSGREEFTFDDGASSAVDTCCSASFKGSYRPMGTLSTFLGSSMVAKWTLVAQDMKLDTLSGSIVSWGVTFTAAPCFKRFSWTNLTSLIAADNAPLARYAAKAVSYDRSYFIFGGRDSKDRPLMDLHRLDIDTLRWTVLTPIDFHIALETSSAVGCSFSLTSWGLLRFGGYYRQATMTGSLADNYGNEVFVMDPVTLRWKPVDVHPWPNADEGTFGSTIPATRYLSAIVFISAAQLSWKNALPLRALYDEPSDSSRINYQGTLTDSLMIFGGFDGATGSVYDGSSGGLLDDIWMLRLSNWSTPGERFRQQKYLETRCGWRKSKSARSFGTESCLSTTNKMNCNFKDLIMLPWCSMNNQSWS
mmetsp:Transcript_177/g.255  ORF Transcript_177/g.255 Transcript_177/m.255 type:complete len:793 (+) Transcript_177:1-2379(+)